MDQSPLPRSGWTCKRPCRQMPPFSGTHLPLHSLFDGSLTMFFSTQETLDEGVEKMRKIYKQFDQVGIKDRSMIWNS